MWVTLFHSKRNQAISEGIYLVSVTYGNTFLDECGRLCCCRWRHTTQTTTVGLVGSRPTCSCSWALPSTIMGLVIMLFSCGEVFIGLTVAVLSVSSHQIFVADKMWGSLKHHNWLPNVHVAWAYHALSKNIKVAYSTLKACNSHLCFRPTYTYRYMVI